MTTQGSDRRRRRNPANEWVGIDVWSPEARCTQGGSTCHILAGGGGRLQRSVQAPALLYYSLSTAVLWLLSRPAGLAKAISPAFDRAGPVSVIPPSRVRLNLNIYYIKSATPSRPQSKKS